MLASLCNPFHEIRGDKGKGFRGQINQSFCLRLLNLCGNSVKTLALLQAHLNFFLSFVPFSTFLIPLPYPRFPPAPGAVNYFRRTQQGPAEVAQVSCGTLVLLKSYLRLTLELYAL